MRRRQRRRRRWSICWSQEIISRFQLVSLSLSFSQYLAQPRIWWCFCFDFFLSLASILQNEYDFITKATMTKVENFVWWQYSQSRICCYFSFDSCSLSDLLFLLELQIVERLAEISQVLVESFFIRTHDFFLLFYSWSNQITISI